MMLLNLHVFKAALILMYRIDNQRHKCNSSEVTQCILLRVNFNFSSPVSSMRLWQGAEGLVGSQVTSHYFFSCHVQLYNITFSSLLDRSTHFYVEAMVRPAKAEFTVGYSPHQISSWKAIILLSKLNCWKWKWCRSHWLTGLYCFLRTGSSSILMHLLYLLMHLFLRYIHRSFLLSDFTVFCQSM